MEKYDYLIVGAGLFGSVFAGRKIKEGKSCLVLDRRPRIAGNLYTEELVGIQVHQYGPHIFHTSDREVWEFVNRYAKFNHFRYEPVANYKGELYNLPFNMNTFYRLWGVRTPQEAEEKLKEQRKRVSAGGVPANLEEQALALIGRDIYEKLVKGYTEKQWGRPCRELPASIIKRLPVRLRYDNNYFNDVYQGIPVGGYTRMIGKLLEGCDIRLETDYLKERPYYDSLAKQTVYTGAIDEFYGYRYGPLAYRSLRFETQTLAQSDYQGVAGMNYTDSETPFTRIVEHKHFEFGEQPMTVVTREYSAEWSPGMEAFYPVDDEKSRRLFLKYRALAALKERVSFGGRLAEYRYYDMDQVVRRALDCAAETTVMIKHSNDR